MFVRKNGGMQVGCMKQYFSDFQVKGLSMRGKENFSLVILIKLTFPHVHTSM